MADAAQAELGSRKSADALLELNPDEWCGAPFESADLATLEARVRKAAANPDDLDKQLRLLSSESEAETLGLRALLSAWHNAGVRYEGVASAIDAIYFRSAAESLMRDNPVLARHTGKVHDQVRERFRSLDKEILRLNRQMIAAALHQPPNPSGRSRPIDEGLHRQSDAGSPDWIAEAANCASAAIQQRGQRNPCL